VNVLLKMKNIHLSLMLVLVLAGCSSAMEGSDDGGEANDTGASLFDAADASGTDAAPADTREQDAGTAGAGADVVAPDTGDRFDGGHDAGEDAGIDAGDGLDAGGDSGGDGGTTDPCEGVYPPECLLGLLDSPDRCDPAKAAAMERIAKDEAAAMRLPMQWVKDAWFVYVGAAATVEVAGDFNTWTSEALERICGLDLWARKVPTGGGKYEYKLVKDGTWILDPANRAFAYDDFAGNADGKNSVLNIWGSGHSHLEWWRDVASPQLGNTHDLYIYVPEGYIDYGAQAYPAIYMQDGQNIFDDSTCCFGNGGWEANVAADAEIVKAGMVPYFIIGIANTPGRSDEYTPCVEPNAGDPFGGKADLYEQFLLETVIPLMEANYHLIPGERAIAGSSLGGNISMYIGLRHPDQFKRGIGSMSGAFWVCRTEGKSVRDQAAALPGHLDIPIYLDSGGDMQSGADGANDTIEVRDILDNKGWHLWEAAGDAPCAGAYDLCYHLEEGATHNETAWRDRVWRMLGYIP